MKKLLLLLLPFSLLASDALVRKEEWKFTKTKSGYSLELKRTVKRLGWRGKDFMKTFDLILPGDYPFRVVRAYTVNSMGKKVDVPRRGITTDTAPALSFFPYFTFLKLHRINFPALEVPSESHLDIIVKIQDERLDWSFQLLEPFPSLEKRWIFVGFEKIKYFAPGFSPQEFRQSEPTGGEAMGLRFVNLPPYPPEPLQPPSPSLIISSWGGWSELAREVQQTIGEAEKNGRKFPDVFSVLKFVRANLKIVKLPIKWSLLYARSPRQVLNSGYASPVEAALVLRWLFSSSGYNPLFYLEASSEYFSEQVPSLSQFSGAGVYLPGPGLYISSSLVPEKLPPQKVLWIFSEVPHLLRTSPLRAEENGILADFSIEEGRIEGKIEGKGNFLIYGDGYEQAKKYAEALGLEISLEKAGILGNTLELAGKLMAKDGLVRLRPDMGLLPRSKEGFGQDRITPVEFPQPFFINLRLRVKDLGNLIFLPSPSRFSSKYGRFSLEIEKNPPWVMLNYRVEVLRKRIPPAEATSLKKLIHLCRDENLTSLVFLPE